MKKRSICSCLGWGADTMIRNNSQAIASDSGAMGGVYSIAVKIC
jgi:hypothetical protein